MIDDDSLWNCGIDKVEIDEIKEKDVTYFDICGIASNELAFSNAFAFFMKRYPHLLVKFAEMVLHKEFVMEFDVAREEANIDLLIRGGKRIVVVENKVKS